MSKPVAIHQGHGRWKRMKLGVAKFLRNPVHIVAGIGFMGFLIDMTIKPISNAGLILLALASSPWLTKLIKSAKLPGGLELELATPAPPESTGTKLAEELSETSPQTLGAPSSQDQAGGAPQTVPGSAGRLYLPNQGLALAYLAEGLVLQELQRETGGLLQRNVLLGAGRARELDGLITTADETIAVEIKLFIGRPPPRAIIDQLVQRLEHLPFELKATGHRDPRVVIALVTDDGAASAIDAIIEMVGRRRVELRHFKLPDLLAKYGFSSEEKKQGSGGPRID